MLAVGILAGVATALLQAISYVCSASFMQKYRSSLRLVIFSQLVMGAFSLLFLPFFFPTGLEGRLWEFFGWIVVWVTVFMVGQVAFFSTLRSIEASRMSSLLGLKIIVLAFLYVAVMRESLAAGQWLAVVLSAAAAVGMNWSGGNHFTLKGLFWLLVTLVFYSLTDMTENHLVRMPEGVGILRTAFGVGVTCYAILGVLTLPMLWKFRWTTRQFVLAIPFAASWFFSQVALFVCFGLLGTVFGNVIQASCGLISIGIGMLLVRWGLGKLDARISRRMWLRRIAAGILMTAAIILYAVSGA